MRISRLRLQDFRGWSHLDLRPRTHVLLAGVPRAGRSDVTAALGRLLDPAAIRLHPVLTDIRQRRQVPATTPTDADSTAVPAPDTSAAGDADGDAVADAGCVEPAPADYAEAEVTLVDLDPELEQLCDGFLEPLDPDGQVDVSGSAAPDGRLGVRLSYRVRYDPDADALDHVLFFPVRSNPANGKYARVPTAVRRALPVVVLNAQRPLQLRGEGVLRRLVCERDADGASAAFRTLEQAVAAATDRLSADKVIAATVDAVLQTGGLAQRLAEVAPTASDVRFRPEDGSLSALLRAIQPALDLDDAGPLTLTSHGSTATAVLAAAEALLLAASTSGVVVLGDDFGEGLDAATAEHVAAVLRARAAQVWLTTRRPEVAKAFAPAELVRLGRRGGTRTWYVLPEPVDRKEVAVRRLLHAQLLPALTAPVVAIVEGPHDVTTYSSAERHRVATGTGWSLAAAGVRLISADSGSGGGTGQIPRVAALARAMGFRVIALIDCDPAKTSADTVAQIEAACDVVVRLPTSCAIEVALVTGVDVAHLRKTAEVLPAYGVPDPTSGAADGDVPKAIAKVLHKQGLHEQFLDALVEQRQAVPPAIDAALTAVALAARADYAGPARIDLTSPTTPPATGTP